MVLFERATFLVISHAMLSTHYDVHRFEKVIVSFSSPSFIHAQFFSFSFFDMTHTSPPTLGYQVSNIVKQFKLSVCKTQAQFEGMEVGTILTISILLE